MMRKLCLEELRLIVTELCGTPFGQYRVGQDGEAALWLQFVLKAPNYADSREASLPQEWRGRKMRVSRYSTEREVVGTAFAALLLALEHEARESFTWHGYAVFGPHIPLHALIGGCREEPDRR